MFEIYLEVLVCLLILYFFVKQEKPQLKFMFIGAFFFFVSLILQLPFKFIEIYFEDYFNLSIMPTIFISILIIVISEITKYFSLKRFLNTRSYKNALLFGITWSALESVLLVSYFFYSNLFAIFGLNFSFSLISSEILPLWNFIVFFIVNLGVSVLVIFSVIKKKIIYLIYSILFSIVVFLSLLVVYEKIYFEIIFIVYSLYLLFKYRKIK